MSWNPYDAPYLSSYDKALEWHNTVVPIRGDKDRTRPLGKRRYHRWANIKLNGNKVELMFEGFLLVQWRPDNSFEVFAPHYYHAQQAEKMNGWLPQHFRFLWDSKRLFVHNRDDGTQVHLPYGKSLRFELVDGKFKCVDVEPVYEYRMKRNAGKAQMGQHLAPFLAWAQVVLSSAEPFVAQDSLRSYAKFRLQLGYSEGMIEAQERAVAKLDYDSSWRQTVNRFACQLLSLPFPDTPSRGKDMWFSRPACELMFSALKSEDYETWTDMLKIIGLRTGTFMYRVHNSIYKLTYEQLENYLRRLVLFLYRDELFDIQTVTDGKIPSARNAEFFNELEHVF